MSTKIIRGPYEILDAYLFNYSWKFSGGYHIREISGIVVRRPDEDGLEDEALFISNNSTSKPCLPYFLVSYHEGVSLEGYVWYQKGPADGITSGDFYTVRKAFADEISIKIQHHKDTTKMLESNMKRIFPEGEELRVPDKFEGPGFGE